MSLGSGIRQLRLSRGLTQSQLGGPELSKSFISLVEKDRAKPSVDTLQLIARRLGTSVDALLGQGDHLPEMVCAGLLALSRDAIRNKEYDRATKLLETARYVAEDRFDDVLREAKLQTAEIAVQERKFEEVWSILTEVLGASEKARDPWHVGRALSLMGLVKMRLREFPLALQLLEKAVTALRRARAGRDIVRVDTLIRLGTTLGYMGDHAGAIRWFEEAAGSEIAQHDPVVRGQALWGIGQSYRKMGNLDAATRYLLEAKDAMESAEELPDFARVLKAVGQLYFEKAEFKKALRYFHQSLRTAERLRMGLTYASSLTEIARVHLRLDNVEDAQHFGERALHEAEKVGDPVEIAEASVVLARIFIKKGDTSRAVALFEQAIQIFKERAIRPRVAEIARELGLFLREQGAHAKAAAYLALSLDSAKQESSWGSRVTAQTDV